MALRRTRHLLAALIATACLPASTHAAPTAKLHVTLTPEQLGRDTNLAFRLHINTPHGQPPTAVTELNLNYPSSLGLTVGGLGLVSCQPITLEEFGPEGCSTNARMGQGHALAEIQVGPETFSETAEIAVLRAPEQQNHIGMYFYVEAHTPLTSEIIVPGLLIPAATPSEETLQIKVPLLKVFPEGPYLALVQLDASIGSSGLTYHEHTHGHLITYKPAGILLPDTCPRGGFQFTAALTFMTGAHTTTQTRVPCPTMSHHTRHLTGHARA
jgi:hypothetical protein